MQMENKKSGITFVLFIGFSQLWLEYMHECVVDTAIHSREMGSSVLIKDNFCQGVEAQFVDYENFMKRKGNEKVSRIYIQGDECPLKLSEWMALIDKVRERCERYGMVSEWEEIEDGKVEWIK